MFKKTIAVTLAALMITSGAGASIGAISVEDAKQKFLQDPAKYVEDKDYIETRLTESYNDKNRDGKYKYGRVDYISLVNNVPFDQIDSKIAENKKYAAESKETYEGYCETFLQSLDNELNDKELMISQLESRKDSPRYSDFVGVLDLCYLDYLKAVANWETFPNRNYPVIQHDKKMVMATETGLISHYFSYKRSEEMIRLLEERKRNEASQQKPVEKPVEKPIEQPVEKKVDHKRYSGKDRVQTSENTANVIKDQGRPTVLVNKNSFKDGLSAYNLCKKFNARLLLISPKSCNLDLINNRYKSNEVYLVGGPNEIDPSIDNYIVNHSKKNYNRNVKVIRVQGNDAYARNISTLKLAGLTNIAVADGRQFPDALAASGLLNKKNMGLMLVKGNENYTIPAGFTARYTIGGVNSVKKQVGKRLAGSDRYETAKVVAREANGYKNVLFVDGRKFPDSISAINLVKPKNSIVLPVSDTRNNNDMKTFYKNSNEVIFIGGVNSISNNTVNEILGQK